LGAYGYSYREKRGDSHVRLDLRYGKQRIIALAFVGQELLDGSAVMLPIDKRVGAVRHIITSASTRMTKFAIITLAGDTASSQAIDCE